MRDDDRGAFGHQVGKRGLHQRFAFGVERRRGLVEDEDGRVLEQGAGDGEPLAFSAGEAKAFFADHRVVTLGEIEDEVVGERCFGGLDHAVG